MATLATAQQTVVIVSNPNAQPTNEEPEPELKSSWNLVATLVIVIVSGVLILVVVKLLDRLMTWAQAKYKDHSDKA